MLARRLARIGRHPFDMGCETGFSLPEDEAALRMSLGARLRSERYEIEGAQMDLARGFGAARRDESRVGIIRVSSHSARKSLRCTRPSPSAAIISLGCRELQELFRIGARCCIVEYRHASIAFVDTVVLVICRGPVAQTAKPAASTEAAAAQHATSRRRQSKIHDYSPSRPLGSLFNAVVRRWARGDEEKAPKPIRVGRRPATRASAGRGGQSLMVPTSYRRPKDKSNNPGSERNRADGSAVAKTADLPKGAGLSTPR